MATLTAITMIAFAANSVIARMALGFAEADPTGFTAVRLITGAATLWLVVTLRGGQATPKRGGSWMSAWWLFLYAITFSYAYLSLAAGTGALIMFGLVQLTMILYGLWQGERPRPMQWFGLWVALAGFFWLVTPGVERPSVHGALLMSVAGFSWGVYSIRGRGVSDPVAVTTDNFMRSVPLVVVIAAIMLPTLSLSPRGFLLAALSGSLASGLGYVLWYTVLPRLTTTLAAIVQLAIPLLAAIGGVALLSEPITVRLLLSGAAILGGVGIAVAARERGGRLRADVDLGSE